MQRINQKGFSVVEALIILVVLGLLAFAGLFVWGRQRTNDTNLTQTGPSQAPKPSSNMQDKSKILVGKLDGSFGVDFSFQQGFYNRIMSFSFLDGIWPLNETY